MVGFVATDARTPAIVLPVVHGALLRGFRGRRDGIRRRSPAVRGLPSGLFARAGAGVARGTTAQGMSAMELLAQQVLASIRRQNLIPDKGRVLVAVSGGGDSVALLCLLAELARHGALHLVGVAHFNHQLRPPASDEDERFCRSLADRFDLPCVVESAAVAALARRQRISIEHAGHRARHQFFVRAAQRTGATHVAIGHTRDDQAETCLLRLLRGAGAAGLAAIRPRRGPVVRPLLAVRRAELRAYLASRGVPFREDGSNLDQRVPRNRVRHDLLPYLERYSPQVVERLACSAEIARADEEWLAQAAHDSAAGLVAPVDGGVEFDAGRFASLHPALGRRIARNLLARMSGRAAGFDQIERLRRLAGGAPTRIDLPGCRAERLDAVVRVTARVGRGRPGGVGPFEYTLDVPGEVRVPEADLVVSAERARVELLPSRPDRVVGRDGGQAVSVDVGAGSLAVRNWRPGDRFRPLGLHGHRKKLQDLFVDRKVPRDARSRVPVVLDDTGRVIWIVGLGVGEDFRISSVTTSVLILRVIPLGEML